MRRTLRCMLCWIIGVGSLTFTACHDATTEPPPLSPPVLPPHISPRRLPTLVIGHDTTLLVDEALMVPVTARDTTGRPISNPSITWRSSAPAVASVDASGHVAALAPGTTTVTAILDGVDAQATITVAPQFTQIATGEIHSCGIGQAWCWGNGTMGQIGNGSMQNALTPAEVSGGYRFVTLFSGGSADHVCGIADTGRAYCWGWGEFAQLGNGEFLSSSVPVLVRLVPSSATTGTPIMATR